MTAQACCWGQWGARLIGPGGAVQATEDERARITWCTDPAQLMAWLRKSLTISAVGELFD